MKNVLTLVIAAALLAACVPPPAQTQVEEPQGIKMQAVSINTPGVDGAFCNVQVQARSYTLSTPGSVSVPRTSTPLTVMCNKGEHFRGSVSVRSQESKDEQGDAAYAYPMVVTVPMHLNQASLDRPYSVF